MINTKFKEMYVEVNKISYKKRIKYILSKASKEEIIDALIKYPHLSNEEQKVLGLFFSEREYVLPVVYVRGSYLEYASKSLQNDKDIVLVAVTENGSALECASGVMKSDYDIVLAAVNNWGRALQYAKNKLNDNETIVNTALNQDPLAIIYVSTKYQKNKSNMMNALKAYKKIDIRIYYTFKYNMSRELMKLINYYKNDKEVLLEIASCSYGDFGNLLKYLGFFKQNDLDIIKTHIKANPFSYNNLNEKHKKNIDIAIIAVENGFPVDLLDSKFNNRRDLIAKSVAVRGELLTRYTGYQDDEEIVYAAVKQDGNSIKYASTRLKSTKYMISTAVSNVAEAFKYAESPLNEDIDFQMELLKVNPFVISYVCEEIQKEFTYFFKTRKWDKTDQVLNKDDFNDPELFIDKLLENICKCNDAETIIKSVIDEFILYTNKKDTSCGLDISNYFNNELNVIIFNDEDEDERTRFFRRLVRHGNTKWRH